MYSSNGEPLSDDETETERGFNPWVTEVSWGCLFATYPGSSVSPE